MIIEAAVKNLVTGEIKIQPGDYFFSTMPVKELIGGMQSPAPREVQEVDAEAIDLGAKMRQGAQPRVRLFPVVA